MICDYYYVYPQEVWDAKTCKKLANRIARDGPGTPYPWKGYVGQHWGTRVRYNGGTSRFGDDNWYPGVEWPMPKLAPGFKLVWRSTWGWQLIEETSCST